MLAMLITRPQPRSAMPGSTSLVASYTAPRLRLIIRSHSARSVRAKGALSAAPALLTRMSMGP